MRGAPMISWQSRGRQAPNPFARLAMALVVAAALAGGLMLWATHMGWLRPEGVMAYAAPVLMLPLALVQTIFLLNRAMAWMAG